ncbi:MAG: TlpA disulfide reductase family protein [Bacteroidota bacterium]
MTFRTFLFVLAITLFFANCQSADGVKAPTYEAALITINGQINNPSASQQNFVEHVYGNEGIDIINGKFTIQIPTSYPTVITAYLGNNRLEVYARPGDRILVSFDETDFENTLVIDGPNGTENEILKQYAQLQQEGIGNFMSNFQLSEADFISKIENVQGAGLNFILAAAKQYPDVDQEFIAFLKDHNSVAGGSLVGNYETYHKYMVPQDAEYVPSDTFNTFIKRMSKMSAHRPGIPNYIELHKNQKMALAQKIIMEDSSLMSPEGFNLAKAQVVEENYKDPKIKELMIFHNIYEYMQMDGTDEVEDQYQEFLANASDGALKMRLKSKHEEWAHLQKGKSAPGFTFPDKDQAMHSLADFRGKVVYIDVWATWCGPCLAEQPYLAEIEEEYAGNDDIVFMGVSIDDEKGMWLNAVTQNEMSGVQLFSEGGFNSEINQKYNILGIPRFILIDKEGNLVDATAARPSSEGIRGQLAELVGE